VIEKAKSTLGLHRQSHYAATTLELHFRFRELREIGNAIHTRAEQNNSAVTYTGTWYTRRCRQISRRCARSSPDTFWIEPGPLLNFA